MRGVIDLAGKSICDTAVPIASSDGQRAIAEAMSSGVRSADAMRRTSAATASRSANEKVLTLGRTEEVGGEGDHRGAYDVVVRWVFDGPSCHSSR